MKKSRLTDSIFLKRLKTTYQSQSFAKKIILAPHYFINGVQNVAVYIFQ